jgi:hypothetical protein
LTELKDAHRTVRFGPIASDINSEGTQFGALVTTQSLLGKKFDRGEMVLYSFVTQEVTQHDLTPWMVAELDAPAGFGFPLKTADGLMRKLKK